VGKIDRIDLYEKDDSIYVKIIDYKSGANDIELDEVYNGLKLQLMVYLNSVINKTAKENPDKEIIPAGALYNRIDNPIVNKEDGDMESNMLKALRPTGMLSIESAHFMDDWESGNSLVIPAKKKKGGEYQMDEHLLTGEQMKCVSEYAVKKMTDMEKEIVEGKVNANPYEDSCKYCPYSPITFFGPYNGSPKTGCPIYDI
jgi:ATP-dependent helicase/nuclease subunit B